MCFKELISLADQLGIIKCANFNSRQQRAPGMSRVSLSGTFGQFFI